jgi:hypothetical protein
MRDVRAKIGLAGHLTGDLPAVILRPDATVNSWCQCFTDIADMHTPMKKMKVKGISIPWMTTELSLALTLLIT